MIASVLRSALLTVTAAIAMAGAASATAQDRPKTIHQERSLYRNILVTEDGVRRCMRFTVAELDGQNQSCRFFKDHDKLVFPYGKMVLTSLLVQDNPKRVLILGLGGGTLVHTYSTLFPDAQIVVAEIDPAVTKVAREYFDFKTTDKISVAEEDGRLYIKRAGLKGEKFDVVILDAFNGDYIPEHLMTAEFYQEVKKLLPPSGLVISNTFSSSRLYSAESQTYAKVFGKFYNIRMPAVSGNRIIVASQQPLPDTATLQQRAEAMGNRLAKFDVDIKSMIQYIKTEPDWDTKEKVLTDQYSPVNQLNR